MRKAINKTTGQLNNKKTKTKNKNKKQTTKQQRNQPLLPPLQKRTEAYYLVTILGCLQEVHVHCRILHLLRGI